MKQDEIMKWVVGIVLVIYMIFQLYVSFSFSSSISEISDNLEDISAPYTQYEEQEARIEEYLIEDGYEVLSVFIMNYTKSSPFFEQYDIEDDTICETDETPCYTQRVGVFVDMKSLGTRNTQIWDTLRTMGVVYPNAWLYWITIKSPTDTCKYMVVGNTYREYLNEASKLATEEENLILARELYDKVQENIDLFKECS